MKFLIKFSAKLPYFQFIIALLFGVNTFSFAKDTIQVCQSLLYVPIKSWDIIETADTSFATTKAALSLLIVQLPAGYEFNVGKGNIIGLGNDFAFAPSVSVTKNRLYISYRINSTLQRDTFRLSGLEMRTIGNPQPLDSIRILFATDTIYQDNTLAYCSLIEPPIISLTHKGIKCAGSTDTFQISENVPNLVYTFRNISNNALLAQDITDSILILNNLVNNFL